MEQNAKRNNSLRLKTYDYSTNGAYFVTICVDNKAPILGGIQDGISKNNKAGLVVERWWKDLPTKYSNVEIDSYVVMPDHFHGIIIIDGVGAIHESPNVNRRRMTIGMVIGYFKMNSAKEINILNNTKGEPVWQRSYFDHVIRNDKDLNEVREYITTNPLRWTLKHSAGDS
jgi:putative transposase